MNNVYHSVSAVAADPGSNKTSFIIIIYMVPGPGLFIITFPFLF